MAALRNILRVLANVLCTTNPLRITIIDPHTVTAGLPAACVPPRFSSPLEAGWARRIITKR